jgi:hypothetical protein
MDGNVPPCSQSRIDTSTKITWPYYCVFVGLIQAYYLVDYCLHIQPIYLHESNFGLKPITFLMNEKSIYMDSHMASVDNVGWDYRRFFFTMVLQGGLGKMCGKAEGTIHDKLLYI